MKNRTYQFNESYFSTIDTSEKAYWLGFLYADGYVTTRSTIGITLSIKDQDHLRLFLNAIKHQSQVKYRKSRYSSEYRETEKSYILIHSPIMYSDLIALGCTRNKSLTLTFPTESQVPAHLTRDFIRGYFDGDGCVGIYNQRVQREHKVDNYPYPLVQLVGTTSFLDGCLAFLGIATSIYNYKHSQAKWIHLRGKTRTKLFFDFCYYEDCLCLPRKLEIFQRALGCGLPISTVSE